MKLTVYYNGQYWVGIVEKRESQKLKVCKHNFGSSEPKDEEILYFVNFEMLSLLEQVATHVEVTDKKELRINPKRLARTVAKEMKQTGVSSKAQDAIKLEFESRKKKRKQHSREQQEAEKERKRLMKLQKRKRKHRGR